jgi:hypothetical protein
MRLWICRLELLTDSSQPHNSTMRQARISRATSTQWRTKVAFINESSPSTHRPRISLGNVAIDFSWMGKRDWKTDTCQFWPPTRDVTCVACCLSGWPTFGLRKARLFFRPPLLFPRNWTGLAEFCVGFQRGLSLVDVMVFTGRFQGELAYRRGAEV